MRISRAIVSGVVAGVCVVAVALAAESNIELRKPPEVRPTPVPSPAMRLDARGVVLEENAGVPVSGVVLYAPEVPMGRDGRYEGAPLDAVGANARCNQDAIGSRQNEIAIASNPVNSNVVVSGSNDYRAGDSQAGFYRSTDGGATWADAIIARGPTGTYDAAGDPILAVDRNGRIYAAYIAFDRSPGVDNGVYVHTSTNNGTTWNGPVAVVQHVGGGTPPFEDKPYCTVDISTGSPHLGNFYISWTQFPWSGGSRIYFARSTNGGATFSAPIAISTSTTNVQFSCPTVGPNGEVYVVWKDGNNVKFDRSLDGGVTFGADVTVGSIDMTFPANPCGTWRKISYPVIGCDISNGSRRGYLYASWVSVVGGDPNVYFSRSTDGGNTWSAATRVDTAPAGKWAYHHWMAVNAAGEIGLAWQDTREDAGNCQYKYYGTTSVNGGTNWAANFPISSVASNPSASNFIGDYNGVAFRNQGFYAGWTDLRNDSGDDYAAWFTSDVPANDQCPGTYIADFPFTATGTTSGAVHDYDVTCRVTTSPDVVYQFIPACSTAVTVSLCGSTYDCVLEVRRDGGCPGITLVGCNDDYCGLQSQLSFYASAGEPYYIIVSGYAGASGAYTLNVTGTSLVPAPANDVCPGRSVGSLPYTDSGNTCAAANDHDNCIGPASKDVWYYWYSGSCATDVTVSLCGSNYDTGLEVRAGSSCSNSTLVACNDDYCNLQSQVSFTSVPGTIYYFVVHGFNEYSWGPYTINVTGTPVTPVPDNDECTGRPVWHPLPYTDSGTTCGAANDRANCIGTTSPDVFYYYSAICSSAVTVSLCGSGYDTGLEVRAGGACPGDVLVACNDDHCGLQSQVTFSTSPGTTYFIIVHGYGNGQGAYTINVSEVPFASPQTNDVCPGTTISALPYTDTGSTCSAAPDYATCGMAESRDVVYSLTLDDCQHVTVSLCGSDYDSQVEVRTGGACPGSTQVVCNDDYPCGGTVPWTSAVEFDANPGVTYYIMVGGFAHWAGDYVLNVTGTPLAPANDTCPGQAVTALPYSDSGLTTCAHADYPFLGCGVEDSRDVVYRVSLSTCENVRVTLCGSNYDTRLQVNSGGPCPGTTVVACNDDAYCNGNYTLQSTVTFAAQAGVNYYVLVRGFVSTSYGAYSLNITSDGPYVEPGDACPGVTIAGLPYSTTGNTFCAADQFDDCLSGTGPDVFYSYAPTECQTVTATLCGSGYDTGIEIRTGGACPGTTAVACNDDNFCGTDYMFQSTVQFEALAGQTYYLVVHGFGGSSGPFMLSVTGVPCPVLEPPIGLVIQQLGTTSNVQLDWQANGAPLYNIYRAATPNVPPLPGNLIGTVAAPTFVDVGAVTDPSRTFFYRVTAFSGLATASEPTGDEPRTLAGMSKADARPLPVAPETLYMALPTDGIIGQDNSSKPVDVPEVVLEHTFGPGTAIELATADKAQSWRIPLVIPAKAGSIYVDPAWIGGPNQNKPAEGMQPAADPNVQIYVNPAWIGGPNPSKPRP